MGKLKELDLKLEAAFKEVVAFISDVDTRKPLKDLTLTVTNNYNSNIEYTDDEVAKIKEYFENLIKEIQNTTEVDLSDAIEELRKEMNEKFLQVDIKIDAKFKEIIEELDKDLKEFKKEVDKEIKDINNRVDTFDERITTNTSNIGTVYNSAMTLIVKLIQSKKTTADKLYEINPDKSQLTKAKKAAEDKLIELLKHIGGIDEEGEEDDNYSFDILDDNDTKELIIETLKKVTDFLNESIKALRDNIIKVCNAYTDGKVADLKEYVDERLENVKPNVDICEYIQELPVETSWGDTPRFLVANDEGCRSVAVKPEGIFTDIRVYTSFSGTVMEGQTNNFQVIVRNVSAVPVKAMELTVVLPDFEKTSAGETLFSQPQGETIKQKSLDKNVRVFEVSGLTKGDQTGVTIPITYKERGSYPASAQIKILDKTVIDFDSRDDYSVSTINVNAKSEGEATVDCPLIECKLNGEIPVPVSTYTNSTPITTKDVFSQGRVVKMREGDYLEFNYPITFINMNRSNYYSGYAEGQGLYPWTEWFRADRQEEFIRTELVNIGGNKYVPKPTKKKVMSTIELIGIRVGTNCKLQFIWVIPADITTGNEKHIGKNIKTYVDNFKVLKGEATYTVTVEEGSDFEMYPVISTQPKEEVKVYIDYIISNYPKFNVDSYDIITLNIKKSSKAEIYIVGERSNYLEVGGNVKVDYDKIDKKITVETNELATSRDNITAGDLIINVVE